MRRFHTPNRSLITRRQALQRGATSAAAVSLSPMLGACGSDSAGSPDDPELVELPPSVANISIPSSDMARAAATLTSNVAPTPLFNHCMRTYVFGALLAKGMGLVFDEDLAFVASALHDLGLVEPYMSPERPYEIDSADAATEFLQDWDVTQAQAELIWDAIALHTNGPIAARKAPEIAMVSMGAGVDAAGMLLDSLAPADVARVLEAFPRLGFKQFAVAGMIAQCQLKPFAYTLHPFAEVGRRHIPDFPVPTAEDLMFASAFEE